jgi:alpha-L-fucosidase
MNSSAQPTPVVRLPRTACLTAAAVVLSTALVAVGACAASGHVPAARQRNLAPIRAAALGLFIHYGPSSLLNAPSSDAWWRGIDGRRYAEFVTQRFRPNPSRAAQWVAFAKQMGARYLVFTAKHVDGYRLWASTADRDTAGGVRNWGVSRSRDLLAALAADCRGAGISLYVYFSLLDDYSHAYRVSDRTVFQAEVEQQLTEILTRYGPLAGIWFDGTWNPKVAHILDFSKLVALVHRLQPGATVGNNEQPPFPGEDYSIFEQKMPKDGTRAVLPEQATFPIGDQWFYSTRDAHEKTVLELRRLVTAARRAHVSLLLDVPPRSNGTLDPAARRRVLAATRGLR